ncbi:MAG: metallophosphoesterase family protein [Parabacteroides sp.]
MKRRAFLTLGATSLAGLAFGGRLSLSSGSTEDKSYSVILLGDTHFDTEPASVYHADYNEPVEWLNRVQRAEFARNGEMWRERCPNLLKRAVGLIDSQTKMAFQLGDLIQGDCGNPEVHKKMLDDVMNRFKSELGGLPFVTVTGNHDIRGTKAKEAYHEYMPKRMAEELGKPIHSTNFSFTIGDDVYIALDFNDPEDTLIDQMLKDSQGARNTFILTHGPLLPYDGSSCRWFFHGGKSESETEARRHFRSEFAQRNAICICGHIHTTELADWYGDGGRITQMTVNSVWSKPELGTYTITTDNPQDFGKKHEAAKSTTKEDGTPVEDQSDLLNEYKPGLKRYINSPSAGSYKMTVNGQHVTIDFYAGDSKEISKRFKLR